MASVKSVEHNFRAGIDLLEFEAVTKGEAVLLHELLQKFRILETAVGGLRQDAQIRVAALQGLETAVGGLRQDAKTRAAALQGIEAPMDCCSARLRHAPAEQG